MKKTLPHLILFFLSFNAFSQVGINTTSPNAMLDIASSNQAAPSNTDGILIPKIDAFPATNPTAAQQGMMVYLTTAVAGKQPGFYYWDNTTTSWTNIGTDANDWKLLGNTGTTAANFIGTTDDVPLQFKVNNEKAGAITSAGLVFLGYQAGNINTGAFNTGVGSQALFSNTSGINNSAYGSRALYSNTTGAGNTSNGTTALYSNTTGSNNTAIGEQALYSNTLGFYNTATGRRSLRSNTTGDYNAAHGFQALYTNATGVRNTANGTFALYLNTGSYNTATGMNALYGNITGISNTANGYQALMNTGGNNNTGIGYQALSINTTGNDNTAIGMNAGPNVNNLSNTTSLGNTTTTTASNQVRVGNAAVTSIGGQVGWTTVSDGRFKENVEENVPGLNFIKLLRPVTYRLNRDKVNEMLVVKEPAVDKYSITTTGFIAQEVEKAAKDSGFDFSGVDKPKNEKDFYGLRYAEFVVPLVKAVQEQQVIIVQEQEKNKLLQAEIKTLKENQKAVEERLKAIEEKLNR